jgi:hypothetical protein
MKIELSPVVTLNLSVTPKRNAVVFANLGFKF